MDALDVWVGPLWRNRTEKPRYCTSHAWPTKTSQIGSSLPEILRPVGTVKP